MAQIKCIVVTPEKTALDVSSSFVVVPLFDGELGIGPGHSPLIGRLGFGELRIRKDGGVADRYYVDGGFVQVADNVVSVLTGRLIPAADLDIAAADAQLHDALKRKAHTDELLEQRERLVQQARSQIRLASRS